MLLKLQRLTVQQIDAFCTRLKNEGLSAGSVRLIHAVLRHALAHAVRTNLLARNACDASTLPRQSRREIQPLTMEQAQELLAVAKGHRFEALLKTALVTGMREGELLALRWSDINFEEKFLQVRRTVKRIVG